MKILLLTALLVIVLTNNVYAKFSTNSKIINTLHTISYNIKLNSNGGTYNNKFSIDKNIINLPIPSKEGYTFKEYTDSNNNTYTNNIELTQINNTELQANYDLINYSITYNLDGGVLENPKTTYNIEEKYTLPVPKKENYTFIGWTGSNGDIPEKEVVIENKTNDLEYTANWQYNYALVNIYPIVDDNEYIDGYDDYTFNIYLDDELKYENISNFKDYIKVGTKVRIVANTLEGRTTTYDNTIYISDDKELVINPTWEINLYQAHFYYASNIIAVTANKYKSIVQTPNVVPENLGLSSNFYYISGFTPWETWIQQSRAIGFSINASERLCTVTFGSSTTTNAKYQMNYMLNNGYNFCTNNGTLISCSSNYSTVLNLYNNAWNFLPRSGSGYSVYKDMSCDSGWSTYATR